MIPLKVGNSWTYQSTIYDLDSNITFQGTYLQEVLASIVIDNLTWYYIDKEPEAEQYPRYTNKEDGYYEVSNKNEIEKQIGENLEWMDLPGKKASRIKLSSSANLNQEDKWQEYFEWKRCFCGEHK